MYLFPKFNMFVSLSHFSSPVNLIPLLKAFVFGKMQFTTKLLTRKTLLTFLPEVNAKDTAMEGTARIDPAHDPN